MKKILLIIDLQKQFKDSAGEYEKCVNYVQNHQDDYDCIIGTIFSQNSYGFYNNNFIKSLNYDGCQNCDEKDLEYKINEQKNHLFITKDSYGSETLIHELTKRYSYTDQIDVIGCDLDACVMAVVFQLWDAGFTNFYVLSDYCYTTASKFSKEDVVKIMKRNFGTRIV